MTVQGLVLFTAFCVCALVIAATGLFALLGISPMTMLPKKCCRRKKPALNDSDSDGEDDVEKRRALAEKDIDGLRTQIRQDKAQQTDFMEKVFG